MLNLIENINQYFAQTRTPQQDPQLPGNDPEKPNNPKIPEGPSDTPRPQSDPSKQPIDLR